MFTLHVSEEQAAAAVGCTGSGGCRGPLVWTLTPALRDRPPAPRVSPGCGPCMELHPVWEKLAEELQPLGIKVGRVGACTELGGGRCKAHLGTRDSFPSLPPSPSPLPQIDGPANPVSLQRFGVTHFPQIFHIQGREVREANPNLRSLTSVRPAARCCQGVRPSNRQHGTHGDVVHATAVPDVVPEVDEPAATPHCSWRTLRSAAGETWRRRLAAPRRCQSAAGWSAPYTCACQSCLSSSVWLGVVSGKTILGGRVVRVGLGGRGGRTGWASARNRIWAGIHADRRGVWQRERGIALCQQAFPLPRVSGTPRLPALLGHMS